MLNLPATPQISRKALVVDDNPLSRVLLASLLMQRGFVVTEDQSAESALDKLAASSYDLVVLDILLSKMSGIELCHIIRDELGLVDLPVLAYTAHGDLTTVAHMRMAGFNDFLFKPLDARVLDCILDEVVRH
ncbi:MAG: Response regulator receiver [Proteobacteria bacterium]|nr:Response regulator receiver [Pseudomonadota bacterium]